MVLEFLRAPPRAPRLWGTVAGGNRVAPMAGGRARLRFAGWSPAPTGALFGSSLRHSMSGTAKAPGEWAGGQARAHSRSSRGRRKVGTHAEG